MKQEAEVNKHDRLAQARRASDGLLSLFRGNCGHTWVGATDGSFACPTCGAHDGKHHLASMEPITVQIEDWGRAWGQLSRMVAVVSLTGEVVGDGPLQ